MQVITSKDNELVKYIRKLKEKKYRDLDNVYVIEGEKLIKEAIEENVKIKYIVVSEDAAKLLQEDFKNTINNYSCIYVTNKVFRMLTDVVTPQGILAVIERKNTSENSINSSEEMIIVLDGIGDPGNLGTIIRTIDSAGFSQVIVSKNTADSYNPKVVRSTMGAIFRVNVIISEDLTHTLQELKKQGYETIATYLETNESIYDMGPVKKVVVIGNEANGVSEEVLQVVDKKVKIPMLGKTESLNASVATGIVVYEYVRNKVRRNCH